MRHSSAQMMGKLLLPSYSSGAMSIALEYARRFAPSPDPILVLGERGTGKTSIAHQIHLWSGRRGGFVSYALSATNDELFLDDFFGHVTGAFTGANHSRIGLLEEASEGTLFLDEFGTASRKIQRSLLGILEGRGYRSAGESRLRRSSTRFILATNADIEGSREFDNFRSDLLDRVGYLRLVIPPLRQRRQEILPLFGFFVAQALGLPEHSIPAISAEAVAVLAGADWPGNIRELRAVARYAVLAADEHEVIDVRHFPPKFIGVSGNESPRGVITEAVLRGTLLLTEGNVSEAARKLNVDRRTIQRHLKVYGGWASLRVRSGADVSGGARDMSQQTGAGEEREVLD